MFSNNKICNKTSVASSWHLFSHIWSYILLHLSLGFLVDVRFLDLHTVAAFGGELNLSV